MTALVDVNLADWDENPVGHQLVIHDRGTDPDDGYVLYGWDEIGLFDHEFTDPVYSFVAE